MNKVKMTSTEYQALSDKIDRLSEKISEQFTRIEDVKLSKSEYEHTHETLDLRVKAIEQKFDSWAIAADVEHQRIETVSVARYDKTDAKMEVLNTKIDTLKDTVNQRFDNLRDTTAANRRAWWQWAIGIGVGLFGSGSIGSLIWIIVHLPH